MGWAHPMGHQWGFLGGFVFWGGPCFERGSYFGGGPFFGGGSILGFNGLNLIVDPHLTGFPMDWDHLVGQQWGFLGGGRLDYYLRGGPTHWVPHGGRGAPSG